MKVTAARMEKRLLLGLPVVMLFAATLHTGGGGLALGVWIYLCALIPFPLYPYPRKSRLHFTRLLFAWAGGFFVLSLLMQAAEGLMLPPVFVLPGACGLCMAAACRCFCLPLEKRSRLLLSFLLIFIAGK